MYCFRDWEEPNWIDVCVVCLQGFCPDHFSIHKLNNPSHSCCVRASLRKIKEGEDRDGEEGSPCKEMRVEIPAHSIVYDHTFTPYCHECQQQQPTSEDLVVKYIKESVEASKLEHSSWSEVKKECEHIKGLQQANPQAILNLKSCSQCDLEGNLWLCLSCGELGCGRRQIDGSGGNGHASNHYSTSRHPCSVKLGTLKNAHPDVYCYVCDEMVLDPHLDRHLELYNIDRSVINPEKGMDELQYEQNINFQMTTEDGKEFEMAKGVLGIHNLGNSCYMASILQPVIRLVKSESTHDPSLCSSEPKSCLQCQFVKLQSALLSEDSVKIKPWMLKQLLGKGHEEFSSSRQQDAAEFFAHLLKSLNLYDKFSFTLQQSLRCADCGFVSAQTNQADYLQTTMSEESDCPIDLTSLIQDYFGGENVDIACGKCNGRNVNKKYGLINLPNQCLVVVIGRSALKNWVPCKVDTAVQLPQTLDLENYMETLIEFVPEANAMEQLLGMGFSHELCKIALQKHENNVENALNALLAGEINQNVNSESTVDEIEVVELMSMGFDQELVVKALKKTKNKEAACELLLTDPSSLASEDPAVTVSGGGSRTLQLAGFVSHKGSSLHCGHYIAHVRVGDRWLLFNDDRVVVVPEENVDYAQAYMAFYC